MSKKLIIGFDFSINKPAATILYEGRYYFYIWPLTLTKYEDQVYGTMSQYFTDFHCLNRNLESITKSSGLSTSEMAYEHTRRSVNLADTIVANIKEFISDHINDEDIDLYVVSEGLSFASKGNSTLDLAVYKGVLLAKIYEAWENVKIFTYAPMTIKKVAGCSGKECKGDKHAMINSFMNQDDIKDTTFYKSLAEGELSRLSKKNETEYYHCVDDLVDSYFAVKTFIEKDDK